jgi:diguanylate cyclase (GGDEF)-like protein
MLPRLAALALAAGCTTTLQFVGFPVVVTILMVLCWGLLGGLHLGLAGFIAAIVPLCTLIPGLFNDVGRSPLAVIGWTAASGSLAVLWHLLEVTHWHHATRDLRDRLRQSQHQQRHLANSVGRYPALQEASLALAGVRDIDHLAHELCRQIRAVVPDCLVAQVHIGLANQLSCRASADSEGSPVPTEPTADECYVATEARILTRRAAEHIRVMLPLCGERRGNHSRDALCGVLVVALPNDIQAEQLHVEMLTALAQLGGIGLAAVELVGRARALALRDDLTELFGQCEFLRRLDEQVASARRQQQPLGLVMCDLDHLKRFNDSWGHAAGDIALKTVARTIQRVVEPISGGIACRYGGEEFALCLPGCSDASLKDIAERLRIDIANAISDPLHPHRRVTASLGIASLRPQENGRALLIRADAATYRAKANGRNCVESANANGELDPVPPLPTVTEHFFTASAPLVSDPADA